jgi:hypothetical protein
MRFAGVSVLADADTDTLQWYVSEYGTGVRRTRLPAAPLHDAGSDFAATDRGHTAAEIDMQARHERDAHGVGLRAHCCLHAEHVNT